MNSVKQAGLLTNGRCNHLHARHVRILFGGKTELRQEMISRANGRSTFPQIFIGSQHVGGCDDLHALEETGRLDALLAQDA
jgi:glutaredoxin-related protein